jgi:hypothetical protein
MYLNFYQKKIGLKAQTPDERVYKAGNFWQILGFFHFISHLYSELSFLEKLLHEYVEQTPYYRF